MAVRDAERIEGQTGASQRRLLGTLVVAVIGFAVQQTSVVPAVTTVQHALGGSAAWGAWLVTVYLIVATVATPAMGRLGDLHGRRRMLLLGLGVFAVGSIAAALAPNLAVLIACRAVQGIGGAVYPLCLAIAREHLPEPRMNAAVGLLTAAFGVGTAIGFVGGGVLAEYASWRWIFAAGAVLVLFATALIPGAVPPGASRARGGYDVFGTAVLSVAVVGLLAALTLVVTLGWLSPATLALLVVAVVAAALWVGIEIRRKDPLIDIHVLREPTVAVANLATIGLGWAMFSSYLLLPQFVQTPAGTNGFGLGGTPTTVGLLLLPLAVGQIVAGPAAGLLSSRIGSRPVFAGGLALIAAALVLLCWVHRGVIPLALLTLLLGIGAGAAVETSSAVVTAGVADDVAAVSSSVNSTLRRLAGGIGGQVTTMLLASMVIGSTGTSAHTAYVTAYLVAAVLSAAGAVLVGLAVRTPRARDE